MNNKLIKTVKTEDEDNSVMNLRSSEKKDGF